MSDLLTRLRANSAARMPMWALMEEATAEIERLQAENNVLWKCVRNKTTEQQSLEAVKCGEYMTSEELLEHEQARAGK